jgi:hypothetical protein
MPNSRGAASFTETKARMNPAQLVAIAIDEELAAAA